MIDLSNTKGEFKMKKFLIILAVIILAIIALAFVGPIILLGIGAAMVYYSYQSINASTSLVSTLWWGIIGIIGVSILLSSIPSLIGIAAVVLLYYVYKQIQKDKTIDYNATTFEYSDVTTFDEEWNSIMGREK